MNYEKYTKAKFEAVGLNTPEARALADQLQDDVDAELHTVLLPKFQEIVSKLNAGGHNLTPYDEIQVGDIAYRDEPTEGDCHLRLGYDTVVSAGYADTISSEQAERELFEESTEPTDAPDKK
jgi:hypothetical protein